nr:MAG TPA: distal tail protein [Caudoviricetes sp.]
MFYLIINGFNTSTILHSVVTDFGISECAEPKTSEIVDIYGMNGSYRVLDGSYKSYERTVSFYLPKLIDISTIIEKFHDGKNEIEFGYHPDSLFYAEYISASYHRNGPHAYTLDIKLLMHPFRYPKNVAPVVFTNPGTIDNIGTVYSEPVIEIEGNGDVSLTIGRKTMHLSIIGKATIDCRQGKQNIFNVNGAVQNTLRKRGGFFEIPVGSSGVTFTGNVRKVTIRPNWRYLV